MSRSYRKPYAYCCGVISRQKDRSIAARSVRCVQNRVLNLALKNDELEDLLLPHFRQCPHNDPWGWNSDGGASLVSLAPSPLTLTHIGIHGLGEDIRGRIEREHMEYQVNWFKKCSRK